MISVSWRIDGLMTQSGCRESDLTGEYSMAGNSFGRLFRVTTYGESHGKGIGVIIDGTPPGIAIDIQDIQKELDRRRPGQSAVTTSRSEKDRVEFLSGLFEGKTTGTPIGMFIHNSEYRSSDYENIREVYRPGHADYTYAAKYGLRDWRGSGRASGRETASRVAAGAVAKLVLKDRGISLTAYAIQIGGISIQTRDLSVIEQNEVRAPDLDAAERMKKRIEEAIEAQDSIGGIVEAVIRGLPAGLGDPVFEKLEALLASAIMSIGAVRGFEIGAGFEAARMMGSQYNDQFYTENGRPRTRSNNAGGVIGGISTGMDIVFRAAVRPPASIARPQKTIDETGKTRTVEIRGRHDPCIVPRIVVVIEAMAAITILDCLLVQSAYSGFEKET